MKKLYRSREDRVFLGVCGGLAEYFEIDPVIVRLIFVLVALAGGAGIVFYLVAALVIPESPNTKEKKMKNDKAEDFEKKAEAVAQDIASEAKKQMKNKNGSQVFGLILIGLGLFFMLEGAFPWFNFGNFWWLILIGFGLFLLLGGRKSRTF